MAGQQELAGSEDPKPRIEEGTSILLYLIHLISSNTRKECAESHHCQPLKAKLESCTAVIEGGQGREGETCVEEFFDLMVIASCACCMWDTRGSMERDLVDRNA